MSIMLRKKVSHIQICDPSEKKITCFEDVIISKEPLELEFAVQLISAPSLNVFFFLQYLIPYFCLYLSCSHQAEVTVTDNICPERQVSARGCNTSREL